MSVQSGITVSLCGHVWFTVIVFGFAPIQETKKHSAYITNGAPPVNALPEIEAGDGSPSDKLELELLIIDCLGQDTRTAQNASQGKTYPKLKPAAKTIYCFSRSNGS